MSAAARAELVPPNGISGIRTRKQKVTTEINLKLNIAPILLDRIFSADLPNQKQAGNISSAFSLAQPSASLSPRSTSLLSALNQVL